MSEGEKRYNDAEHKLSSAKSFLSKVFSNDCHLEDVADDFIYAANAFKREKRWKDSALSFERAAECHKETNYKMAECLKNAGYSWIKINDLEAIRCFENAIQIFCDLGNWRIAGNLQKEIAGINLNAADLKGAIISYKRAVDYYEAGDCGSLKCQMTSKLADMYAQIGDYPKAIYCYNNVAKMSVDNLRKFNLKDYALRNVLCRLAMGDPVAAQNELIEYENLYPIIMTTMEHKFACNLVTAFLNMDTNKFYETIKDYNKIKILDDWTINILNKIKISEMDLT